MKVKSGFTDQIEKMRDISEYNASCSCTNMETLEKVETRDQKMRKTHVFRCNSCGDKSEITFKYSGEVEYEQNENGIYYEPV